MQLKPRDHFRYDKALTEWNRIVDEIRSIEGFQYFLKPNPYSNLQNAAIGGPVIVVNASRNQSDALLIRIGLPICLIPLPDATEAVLKSISKRVSELGPNAGEDEVTDPREQWGGSDEEVSTFIPTTSAPRTSCSTHRVAKARRRATRANAPHGFPHHVLSKRRTTRDAHPCKPWRGSALRVPAREMVAGMAPHKEQAAA